MVRPSEAKGVRWGRRYYAALVVIGVMAVGCSHGEVSEKSTSAEPEQGKAPIGRPGPTTKCIALGDDRIFYDFTDGLREGAGRELGATIKREIPEGPIEIDYCIIRPHSTELLLRIYTSESDLALKRMHNLTGGEGPGGDIMSRVTRMSIGTGEAPAGADITVRTHAVIMIRPGQESDAPIDLWDLFGEKRAGKWVKGSYSQ